MAESLPTSGDAETISSSFAIPVTREKASDAGPSPAATGIGSP